MCVCGGGEGMASGAVSVCAKAGGWDMASGLGRCPSDETDTGGKYQMQCCNTAGKSRGTAKEPHLPGSGGGGRQWRWQDGATSLDL